MGQVRKLIDVVATMESLEEGATIYVGGPWSSESPAIVEVEPSSGGLPAAATKAGLKYFLEVFVAREFLAGCLLQGKKRRKPARRISTANTDHQSYAQSINE